MAKLNAFFQFPMDDNFQQFYNMERRADITELIETQQRDNEPHADFLRTVMAAQVDMILDGCEISFSLKGSTFKSMGMHVCMHAHMITNRFFLQLL